MTDEPCEFCPAGTSGPVARTPFGICEACACSECRGFRKRDDRGFLYTGSWPSLFFTDCVACKGEGTRSGQAPGVAAKEEA